MALKPTSTESETFGPICSPWRRAGPPRCFGRTWQALAFGIPWNAIPSRELTYPILRKGTSSSQKCLGRGYFSYKEGTSFILFSFLDCWAGERYGNHSFGSGILAKMRNQNRLPLPKINSSTLKHKGWKMSFILRWQISLGFFGWLCFFGSILGCCSYARLCPACPLYAGQCWVFCSDKSLGLLFQQWGQRTCSNTGRGGAKQPMDGDRMGKREGLWWGETDVFYILKSNIILHYVDVICCRCWLQTISHSMGRIPIWQWLSNACAQSDSVRLVHDSVPR